MLRFLPLALAAAAHAPHHTVHAVAAPGDLSEGVPWLLSLDCEGRDQAVLYRSDDGGISWNAVGGEPTVDNLRRAAMTDDGRYLLLGEERYFWSDDAETWQAVELGTGLQDMDAGALLALLPAEGVLLGEPGGTPELELAGVPLVEIRHGEGGFVALDAGGGVRWRRDGEWQDLGAPEQGPQTAVATEDAVYAGFSSGAVWRWSDAGWQACGAVPGAEGDYAAVTFLAAQGGRLLAMAWEQGPAFSDDDCASWTQRAADLNLQTGESAKAADENEATTALLVSGDRWLVAGYDTAWISEDAGQDWHEASTLPGDYARAIAFSPEFPDDGGLLMAGYSSGLVRSDDFGAGFQAPGLGLEASNCQGVAMPRDGEGMTLAYGIASYSPYRSRDGGRSWEALDAPPNRPSFVVAGAGERVWLISADSSDRWAATYAVSDDAGESWREFEALAPLLGTGLVTAVVDRDPLLCVGTPDSVFCSQDGGESWAQLLQSEQPLLELAMGPEDSVTELAVAGDGGIWLYRGEGSWEQVFEADEEPLRNLAFADDGTGFAATRSGRLLRSEDGGESWQHLPGRLPAPPRQLAPRPGFADWPELLVASYDGIYAVDPDGAAERFARYQPIDDASEYVRCLDCAQEEDPGAAIGSLTRLATGDRLRVNLRGHSLQLLGAVESPSSAAVWVDGAEHAFAWDEAPLGSVLFSVEGLEDSWHRVELQLVEGEGLLVDQWEARGADRTLGHQQPEDSAGSPDSEADSSEPSDSSPEPDSSEPPDSDAPGDSGSSAGRCGCGGGAGMGCLLVLLSGLLVRRR